MIEINDDHEVVILANMVGDIIYTKDGVAASEVKPLMENYDFKKAISIAQETRWVYGTRTNKWHLVVEGERDWNTAITHETMRKHGAMACKIIYLQPTFYRG